MDSRRFDNLSRSLAQRLSRRQALRGLAAGGIGLGLASSRGDLTHAQADDPTSCEFAIDLETAIGPEQGTMRTGRVTLTVESDGRIEEGSFVQDGEEYPLSGQADGRSLNLRISLEPGEILALNGVGEAAIRDCPEAIAGIFAGPGNGNAGTWTTTLGEGNVAGGSSRSSGTPGPDSSPTPQPTATPCPPIDCGVTFVLDPATCECGCVPPSERCGETCCPGGSVCDQQSGSCQCPAGTEICNEACTPFCPPGQTRNWNSCDCEAGCGDLTCQYSGTVGQALDTATCTCVDICTGNLPYFCGGGCYDVPMTYCNGGCYQQSYTNSNAMLCGPACAVCPTGVPCIAGSCTCPFGYTQCPGGCKDLLSDPLNCGQCGIACAGACSNGGCAA
jgi:hypothetical protein